MTASLVPGVALHRDVPPDGLPRWRLSANVYDPRRKAAKKRSRSPLRHGLDAALLDVCRWRWRQVPGEWESAEAMAAAARSAISEEQLAAMRADGVDEPSGKEYRS